jgi:hypothetical protein
MGNIEYRDKIENNHGVVMGHANSTATDGVRIVGSSTSVCSDDLLHASTGLLTESTEHIPRHTAE